MGTSEPRTRLERQVNLEQGRGDRELHWNREQRNQELSTFNPAEDALETGYPSIHQNHVVPTAVYGQLQLDLQHRIQHRDGYGGWPSQCYRNWTEKQHRLGNRTEKQLAAEQRQETEAGETVGQRDVLPWPTAAASQTPGGFLDGATGAAEEDQEQQEQLTVEQLLRLQRAVERWREGQWRLQPGQLEWWRELSTSQHLIILISCIISSHPIHHLYLIPSIIISLLIYALCIIQPQSAYFVSAQMC